MVKHIWQELNNTLLKITLYIISVKILESLYCFLTLIMQSTILNLQKENNKNPLVYLLNEIKKKELQKKADYFRDK